MNFSSLKKGQIAVVQAEQDTGIVLTPNGQRHLGSGEAFRAFGSLAAARAFAQGVVAANPNVECGLYDCRGAHVERVVSPK
jgi:hypothetical protein